MIGADGAPSEMERDARADTPEQARRRAGLRVVVAAAYLFVAARLGTSGVAHAVLAVVFVALPVTIPPVGRILLCALPFAAFAAIYDLLRLARPFVAESGVHVRWPYQLDKWAFGLPLDRGSVSMNELFATHHWAVVDFITGLSYLSYIYAVLGFAAFMAFIDRSAAGWRRARALGWSFFATNLGATLIYLLCPVAPPWYVATRGFGPVDPNTAASPAALARWDALVGVPYFEHFYAHASDVFGAMPSMHCAYPMLLLLYARDLGRPRLRAALIAFQVLMCFSAVYLQHHYVSDVLAGMLCAWLGHRIERWFSARGRGTPLMSGAQA